MCPLHICFHILHIKSIATVPARDDPEYLLSYVIMHDKRSEDVILKCFDEFNTWHFVDPMLLHPTTPLFVRGEPAYAANKRYANKLMIKS
jgi:hypothetical protein